MSTKKNPFKLTQQEKIIEILGVILFLAVLVGSFLKLMFL